MFVLMKSPTSLKMGHVGSKTRSLGQMLEKPCVPSRGHIFSPIVMKLGQNVCLDEISHKSENGSCSRDQIFSLTLMKLGQSVCLKHV